MFGVRMHNCAVWSINSYNEAVAFHDSCPEKGGVRRIKGKEGSRTMSIRMESGSVRFRYHNTDVVTWHPDGSYEIDPYQSRSTCEFANRFLPQGHFLTKECTVLFCGDEYHPVIGGIKVKADGTVQHMFSGTCFRTKRIDRKAAKRVLARTRYAEYRDWYKAMWPMVRDNRPTTLYLNRRASIGLLEDETCWYDMMTSRGLSSPDDIRKAIYEENSQEVYYYEKRETLPGIEDYSKWETACER